MAIKLPFISRTKHDQEVARLQDVIDALSDARDGWVQEASAEQAMRLAYEDKITQARRYLQEAQRSLPVRLATPTQVEKGGAE